ncbi:hypothetical protein [Siminovitchia fordii]|uniref:hypothetical protein n=1 Tax=Siminovitchia fordii TaxID=254759 RepID=UPI0012B52321|nr:hypothetical protein [Siminovitchia fordii]
MKMILLEEKEKDVEGAEFDYFVDAEKYGTGMIVNTTTITIIATASGSFAVVGSETKV